MGKLLQGDFGKSIINNRPIVDEFLRRFPGTVELTVAALLFAVGLGIPLGRFAARHAQGLGDGPSPSSACSGSRSRSSCSG